MTDYISEYKIQKAQKGAKVGRELQDFGSRMLHGLQTFGGSYIGDAIQGASPKAAEAVSKYTAGMIAPTPQKYLDRNRSSWKNRASSAMDATSMVLAGEVIGPVLGATGKAVSKKVIPNIYKINPFAFKPKAGNFYRGLGKEGAEDAIQSGVFRQKPDVAPKLASNSNINLSKQFKEVYWSPQFKTADRYGKGYIAEVPKTSAQFKQRYRSDWSQYTDRQIPIDQGRILKKDWLMGYKKVNPNKIPNQAAVAQKVYTKLGKMATKKNPGKVKDWLMGASKGVHDISRGRPVFETFPITKKQKLHIKGKQDASFKESMDFMDKWTLAGKEIEPTMAGKIEDIIRAPLDTWDREILTNVMTQEKNLLVGTGKKELKKLPKEQIQYVKKRLGAIDGFNSADNSISVTLRNHGPYYETPKNIGSTAVHEAGHTMQKMAGWGGETTGFYGKYKYFSPNKFTSVGQQYQKVMVPPQEGKAIWEASPNELHSELMAARYKAHRGMMRNAQKLAKERNQTLDVEGFSNHVIKTMKRPDDATLQSLLSHGTLDRFFQHGVSDEVKRRALKILPGVSGVALGANELNKK